MQSERQNKGQKSTSPSSGPNQQSCLLPILEGVVVCRFDIGATDHINRTMLVSVSVNGLVLGPWWHCMRGSVACSIWALFKLGSWLHSLWSGLVSLNM